MLDNREFFSLFRLYKHHSKDTTENSNCKRTGVGDWATGNRKNRGPKKNCREQKNQLQHLQANKAIYKSTRRDSVFLKWQDIINSAGGGDKYLNNIPGGCRQQPPLAQWQTGSSSREEVGLEGLEGSNVIYHQLFIHARCHHVSAKRGDHNRLVSGGPWGHCSSLLKTENVIVAQCGHKAVYDL